MQQNILLHSSMIRPDIGLNSILCCLNLSILGYFLEQLKRFWRQISDNKKILLTTNQKCQAGFRPLCNKILLFTFSGSDYIFTFYMHTKVTFFHQCSKMQIIPIQNLTLKLDFSNFFGFSD